MHEPEHEVIVVGAGPAGSTSARLLALSGLRVLLLDRDAFPRDKPCGECLSPQATVVLERQGLLERVMALDPARLTGWRVVAPGGGVFKGRFPASPAALAVDRFRLDEVLLRAAQEAGVEVRRGTVRDLIREDGRVRGVVVREPDGRTHRLPALLVVGADGLRSVVARRLGLVRGPRELPARHRKISLTVHARGGASSAGEDRALGVMLLQDGACLGIAPVTRSGDRLNLTLVVRGDASGELRETGPKAFFRKRMAGFAHADPALHDLELEDSVLASGPFNVPVRSPVADGAALVGDAAGYFDPFTGQGVFRALAGAELLAPVAAAALREGGPTAARLRPYARGLAKVVTWPRRLQRVIDFVVTRPAVADALLPRISRNRALADALVEVTGDLRSVGSLLAPGLLVHPSKEGAPGGALP